MCVCGWWEFLACDAGLAHTPTTTVVCLYMSSWTKTICQDLMHTMPSFHVSMTMSLNVWNRSSSSGVHGDSLSILQAPDYVSFQKGDWPISGEKVPDLVALTMGFSVQGVRIHIFTMFVL